MSGATKFGDDHPDTLTSASNLALNLWWLGEYQRARALDEDTLTRRRRILGEHASDTLTSASQLAADLYWSWVTARRPGNSRKRC